MFDEFEVWISNSEAGNWAFVPREEREAPAGVEPASAVLRTAARPSGSGAVFREPRAISRGARIRTPCASFGGSLLSQEHAPVAVLPPVTPSREPAPRQGTATSSGRGSRGCR